MLLKDYIEIYYESQAEFAREWGYWPQDVSKWIKSNWCVVEATIDGDEKCMWLMSPRRRLGK